jgi:arylsulfatase A-like enzyme
VAETWMALKGMKGHVLNIAPTMEEIKKNPNIRPPFLREMNPKQQTAWHSAYDPRNLRYRKLIQDGKLEGDAKSLYIYQRFIKDYIRCVDGLDDQIGRILNFLDEDGLAENTLVIYSSDQGFFTGEHGWAEKRWMYEESFKSPLLMRWPKTIKAGTQISKLVQNIDLAPTFLKAAGLSIPDSVHGLPLQHILLPTTSKSWRKDILYQYFDGGTPKKRGPYNMPRHEGIRDERYKLISFYDFKQWEFYDLKDDPRELNNLYGKKQFEPEIERLHERLTSLKADFFD